MGGSGGYFSGTPDPEGFARKVRDAEQSVQDSTFVGDVNSFLNEMLSYFNDRDREGISSLIDTIKNDIEADLESSVQLLFAGSVAKSTYVDGLSDVDMLVCVNKDISDELTPGDLKAEFAETLRARFGHEVVKVGDLAVTLEQNGIIIQLLPVFRRGEGFALGTADGESWAAIAPQKFARKLTNVNQQLSNKLVPVIKLAKALLSELPTQRQFTGYHIEALAINAFRKYEGKLTSKEMLAHFFDRGSNLVTSPIVDSSGQSVHVDGYMGKADSLERRIAADTLSRFHRRILNANGANSLEAWHGLFGHE